ncbi:hypothetical protein VTK73DRAFT_5136 [Phialemonium thermophilum]|uniref:Thioredoxin domain-containing protein n=1 Tax=Phialemonium thermophilum TaxID=223376 RepID=A0ABR3WQ46_9PEZI
MRPPMGLFRVGQGVPPRVQPAITRKGAIPSICHRSFSTSRTPQAKNRVFSPVRNLDQFHTYQLLSASSRVPLLTLWTAGWCATCRAVEPLVRRLIEEDRVGEAEGGVAFCTVEYDAPDVMAAGLGGQYMITSIPTLLSFDAQEAQMRTRVSDARKLGDRAFVEEWIRAEARRHGNRGGGSSWV